MVAVYNIKLHLLWKLFIAHVSLLEWYRHDIQYQKVSLNLDFCHKQSNHKSDSSLELFSEMPRLIMPKYYKPDQFVRHFGQIARLFMPKILYLLFMILVCTDRIELYVMLSQV